MNSSKSMDKYINNNSQKEFIISRLDLSIAIAIEPDDFTENLNTENLKLFLSKLHKKIFTYVPYEHKIWLGIIDIAHNAKIEHIFDQFISAIQSLINNDIAGIANIYAECFNSLIEVEPFIFGNIITIHKFFLVLSKAKIFKQRNIPILDFRNIHNRNDFNLLITSNKSSDKKYIEKLTIVFKQAFTSHKVNSQDDQTKQKIHIWNDASVKIGNFRYLSYKKDNDIYIVCHSGHLVKLVEIQDDLIDLKNYKQINDYKIKISKSYPILLSISEAIAQGYPVYIYQCDDNLLQPICLDIDLFTTMPISDLKKFRNKLYKYKIQLSELYENIDNIDDDDIRFASLQVKQIFPQIEQCVAYNYKKFHNKRKEKPTISIAMGGTGSGKSVCTKLLDNRNSIVASLDEARYFFFVYLLLIAANHNVDDYNNIEVAANIVRDLTFHKAIDNHRDIHIDGSGVPWIGRYEEFFRLTKPSYKTVVIAVETPFVRSDSDKSENTIYAYDRIMKRAKIPGLGARAIPMNIALKKHKLFGISILEAMHSENCDKVIALDMIDSIKPNLLAQTLKVSVDVMNEIKQDSAKILAILDKYELIDHFQYLGNQTINKDKLSSYIVRYHNDNYVLLLIYDIDRFINMIQKAYMNESAIFMENIWQDSDTISNWWKNIVLTKQNFDLNIPVTK